MSYNRKALSKAKLNLDKYKKPNPYKKDILYTQEGQWKYPGQKTRIPSSDITMQGVPFPVFAQPNVGQPQMMYPGQEYMFPGADYVDEYPQMKKGGRPRGLVSMPKPSKKGLASKKYSRSLSATNKLFTENPLFKKPKSKKRKVFDPNAKYYQDGGVALPEDYSQFETFTQTLPSNLQDPNFEYGNPDQYNLYGMWETVGKPGSFSDVQDGEYFPLQDDGTYHGFTVGSDGEFLKPMSHGTTWKEVMNAHLNTDPYFQQNRIIKNEKGRLQYIPNNEDDYIELDLSPEEIEQYAKGGYVIEELPEMQPGGSFKPGTGYKMPTLNKSEMAAVKKEVPKAKPVAAKSTTTVKKPNSSKQVNKSKEDAAYEKFLDQNLGKEGSNTYTYVDPRTGKTEQREYSNAHLKDKGNISVDEATWNANRDRQNMQHLSEALSGVGEITGINSAIRTGERLIDDPLKFADDLTTGISQAPETLVEGAMTLGSKLFGDNKNYVDVDTDALGVVLDVAGALPVLGTASKVAKPVLKRGLKYADDVIYPTRVYRASVANKNLKNLDYGLSGDAEKIAYEKQLIDKINKKGDFYTRDLEELSQYLSGNESRKGVFMGDDMIIDEVKVPFWKKNILSDKDVVALKQSQGSVLPGQLRTLFQSEINSNEFIIPNKSIFYPRKSTLIKGMPQEISRRPVYIKNYKGDVVDISDDFSPSAPFTYDDTGYSNQAYKYLEDQINAATGQNIPLYNPNPLQEHTLLKNYDELQKLQKSQNYKNASQIISDPNSKTRIIESLDQFPENIRPSKEQVQQVIDDNINYIKSPEYKKLRMQNAGETEAEVDKAINSYIKSFNKTKLTSKSNAGNSGQYTRGNFLFSPEIGIDPMISSSDEFLNILDHEIKHGLSPFSQSGKANTYKNYPVLEGTPTAKDPSLKEFFIGMDPNKKAMMADINYQNLPYEQQVRALRLKNQIKKDLGVSAETPLKESDIQNWMSKHPYRLPESLNDVEDLFRVNTSTPTNKGVANWLNNAWMTIPATGITGATIYGTSENSTEPQNYKQGGYINKMSKGGLKNNYIDINVTEDDIIKYVDGGYIVEEVD